MGMGMGAREMGWEHVRWKREMGIKGSESTYEYLISIAVTTRRISTPLSTYLPDITNLYK